MEVTHPKGFWTAWKSHSTADSLGVDRVSQRDMSRCPAVVMEPMKEPIRQRQLLFRFLALRVVQLLLDTADHLRRIQGRVWG